MAQNTSIDLNSQTWTLLTDSDVTSLTFQNQSNRHVFIKGTAGAVAPTNKAGAIEYAPGQGEVLRAVADLWPGISATRVYAYSETGNGKVMVSHA
jgi:hypothetical protein